MCNYQLPRIYRHGTFRRTSINQVSVGFGSERPTSKSHGRLSFQTVSGGATAFPDTSKHNQTNYGDPSDHFPAHSIPPLSTCVL
jgi:hypothetical protein